MCLTRLASRAAKPPSGRNGQRPAAPDLLHPGG